MRTLFFFLTAWLLAGCSSLLPNSQSRIAAFESFDEARQAIEALAPMRSTGDTLRQLGIDPVKQSGIDVLTPADIAQRVLPSDLIRRDTIDPGILACLDAGNDCRGWEISAERVHRSRTGGFWADFANFSRRTETTGWRFKALVLLVRDLVVYRAWGGQPNIHTIEIQTNPLGPLQDMGPGLITPR